MMERNILGLCLTAQIDPVTLGLEEKHFSSFSNKRIWSNIILACSQNKTPDIITIADMMNDNSCDWFTVLAVMANDNIGRSSAENHVIEIKKQWKVRELKNIGSEIVNSDNVDVNEYIKKLMDLNITEKKYLHSFVEAADDALVEIERIMTGGSQSIPTGLDVVDSITGGLHNSDLVIVAARPAMGKTAFLLNVAAANKSKPLIFSTEQSRIQAMFRMFSIYGDVEGHSIRTGNITDEDFGRMSMSINEINKAGGYIYDKSGPYMSEIEATAREVYHNNGCSAIYLDYLQRIKHENPSLPNHEKVGDIAMRLKELARELDIPVMALAQVSRKVEDRADKRPGMGDIKDSGTIEQEADSILTLYRDEVYFDDSPDRGTCEVDFKKNRHGGTGMVRVAWTPKTMKFTDLNKLNN